MKNKNINILLIDDEPDVLEIVSYNLRNEGYNVITAENGLEGIKKAKTHSPHLIISDIMMPKMDGIETCKKIRSIKKLKDCIFVFLTARNEDYSQVTGFETGADDYITKPIKPKVLTSKVKAMLRHLKNKNESSHPIKLNDVEIDFSKYKIKVKNKEIELPLKEFKLLELLASVPGKVFTRDEILNQVWGNEVIVGDRTIDVHIRKLRHKIGDKYFVTTRGVGYKFVP